MQLQLDLTTLDCLEYPDLYRSFRLVATKTPTTHTDQLGRYKAETWSVTAYGNHPGIDGKAISSEWKEPEQAIAAAMQYLDIFIGKVQSKHHYAEFYDQALKRINQRLQP
jgi:hypothetical protein